MKGNVTILNKPISLIKLQLRTLALLLVCVFNSNQCMAENSNSVGIYEKNFALSPVDMDRAGSPLPNSMIKSKTSAQKNSKNDSSKSNKSQDLNENEESGDVGQRPVLAVSVIADGTDKASFEKILTTYFDLIANRNLQPGHVVRVGTDPTIYDNATAKLLARSAFMGTPIDDENGEVEIFHVTKSPAWLVEVPEGTIVLEGLQSPEKFITKTKMLVMPEMSSQLRVAEGTEDNSDEKARYNF